jgi:hypothetical protein
MKTMTRLLAISSVAILGAACGTSQQAAHETGEAPTTSAAKSRPTQQAAATPRLALSYDGGVLVLDARSLEQIADIPMDGFVRLNSAANGRHVLVSQADGFAALDMGTWTDAHGDHDHHYTAPPAMTDIRFGGEEPGHVVAHDGKLTLFSDGTGAVDVVDPEALLEGEIDVRNVTRTTPHHGVAAARSDGTVVVSVGDEDTRTGVVILDSSGKEIAANNECPGLHGEASAADGVLTFGCQDGVLIVRGNDILKVASPDPYGRMGNQSGSETSPLVLADYKVDPDAEIERPQQVSLIDTATGTLRLVPLGVSYSFRSLDRGPEGEAVILGTDGALHIFDPATARRVARIEAIDAWTEPDDWQSPMPNLHIQDTVAYVSDPHQRTVVAIDLRTGSTLAEAELPEQTIELTGVRG